MLNHTEWLSGSPDCNPLDYYFWDKMQIKVYEDRFNQVSETKKNLRKKIKSVWPEKSNYLKEIRRVLKQFIPRLTAVPEKDGWTMHKNVVRLTCNGNHSFVCF